MKDIVYKLNEKRELVFELFQSNIKKLIIKETVWSINEFIEEFKNIIMK